MYSVTAILPQSLADGFALCGLAVVYAETPEQTKSAIEDAIENGDHGIVVVSEEMVNRIDERSARRFHERSVPLIITIPGDLVWRDPEEERSDEYAAALIRRAIGYQLNIRL